MCQKVWWKNCKETGTSLQMRCWELLEEQIKLAQAGFTFRSLFILTKSYMQNSKFNCQGGLCPIAFPLQLTDLLHHELGSCIFMCLPAHWTAEEGVIPCSVSPKGSRLAISALAMTISITLLEGENVGAEDLVFTLDMFQQGVLQNSSVLLLYPRCLLAFGVHQVHPWILSFSLFLPMKDKLTGVKVSWFC